MKPYCSKLHKWSVAVAVASVAFMGTVRAVPYASGVSNNAGVVSFILNESADSVRILLNSGTITNNLGALPSGATNFLLNGATNYQILVSKSNSPGFLNISGTSTNGSLDLTNLVGTVQQISSDANPLLNFNSARGVTVNRDPKSPYFGRIYVANSNPGAVTNGITRTCGDGLYVLNADQTDAVGQGNTALTGGLNFTTGAAATPYRISVGADNNVYIADWSDASGNVYMVDGDVSASSGKMVLKQIFSATAPDNAAVPVGVNNTHGSIAAVYVDGSTAGANLKVYTIDEDLQASKTSTSKTQLNSLWRYDINAGSLPATNDATRMWSPSSREGIGFASQNMDMDRGVDGKFYITTRRDSGSESGLVVRSATGAASAASLYISFTNSLLMTGVGADLLYGSRAAASSPNQRFVAVNRNDGRTWLLPLINGLPDLTNRILLDSFTGLAVGTNRAVRFDAAGNLYVMADGPQTVRIFSPGGVTTAITANNSAGTNATFILHEQPAILSNPTNVTDIAGTNATFTVIAGGPASTLTYQWYFNDALLTGQTTNTLIRTNIQAATSAGYYKVAVSNALYSSVTSAVVSLVVTDSAPIITVQPVSTVTIGAGSNATAFAVTTIGSDARFYQWQLNGTNIMGATTSSLARNNCQDGMAGTYYVTISNAFGSVTSAGTTLTVNAIAPVVTTQPVSRTVAAGSNVTFTVTSTGGTDPRSYFWMVNGSVIDSATNTSYVVTNAQASFSGNAYSVMVSNVIGTFTSTNAILTVTNTPNVILITQPASVTVGAGSNVTFSSSAFGNALVSYQWYMNGGPISGATSNTFVWINAQTNDTGTNFSVTISNGGIPASSSNAVLTVTNKAPIIITQPVSVAAAQGSGASFSVAVQGQGPFTYQWKLGTNNLIGQNSASLLLSNIQFSDAATNYSVVISNAVGSATSTNVQLAVLIASSLGTGTGLTGEYFPNHYLAEIPVTNGYISFTSAPALTRVDPAIDFLWTGSPDPTIPPDYFVVRWTGQVQPLYSQDYTFSTLSDDGIRLWFNGKLLIDQWKSGGSQNYSVVVSNLVAGQKYDIRVEYVEITGNGEAHLFWSSLSQTRAVIPTTQLYPDSGPYVLAIAPTNVVMAVGDSTNVFTATAGGAGPLSYQWQKDGANVANAVDSTLTINNAQLSDIGNYTVVVTGALGVRTSTVPATVTVTSSAANGSGTGLLGEYFTKAVNTAPWYTNTPAFTRLDPSINFNWGTSSADVSVSAETNVIRWTGQIEPRYSQVYTFQSISDDGIRVWVDGQLIIDKWVTGNIAANNFTGTMPYAFVVGQKYDIRVEYFDKSSTSEVHVYWFSGSQPEEIIPVTQLYPDTGAYLITQPTNVNGVLGSNTTLNVYAGGTGTISYQWKKNGGNISGATTSTLTFAPLQLSDAADYSIVVSNSISARTSTNGTLSIAPYITQQPLSTSVIAGSPANFSVAAGGSGILTYQWLVNGTNIVGQTNASYSIGSTALTDSGTYSVKITGFGTITSSNAVLTVSSGVAPTPTITSVSSGGGNLGFSFTTTSGFSYHVQFTSDLNLPFADVEVIAGNDSPVSRSYAVGPNKGFYRILVQ